MVFHKLKKAFSNSLEKDEINEDYLEIDVNKDKQESKVMVKLFVLKQYEDAVQVLNALREGYTIAIIDIKTLKKKDPIELKRAVSKIKKTVDALEGSIAGHEEMIIATPAFAKISKDAPEQPKEPKERF